MYVVWNHKTGFTGSPIEAHNLPERILYLILKWDGEWTNPWWQVMVRMGEPYWWRLENYVSDIICIVFAIHFAHLAHSMICFSHGENSIFSLVLMINLPMFWMISMNMFPIIMSVPYERICHQHGSPRDGKWEGTRNAFLSIVVCELPVYKLSVEQTSIIH